MKRLFVTTSFGALALSTLLLVPIQGCTDLTEAPPSQIVKSQFFRDEGEVLAGLGQRLQKAQSSVISSGEAKAELPCPPGNG